VEARRIDGFCFPYNLATEQPSVASQRNASDPAYPGAPSK